MKQTQLEDASNLCNVTIPSKNDLPSRGGRDAGLLMACHVSAFCGEVGGDCKIQRGCFFRVPPIPHLRRMCLLRISCKISLTRLRKFFMSDSAVFNHQCWFSRPNFLMSHRPRHHYHPANVESIRHHSVARRPKRRPQRHHDAAAVGQ